MIAGLSCSSSTGPDGPDVSLQLSTITSARASIVADGSSTTAITVTLKDSDGAPATGTIGPLVLSTSAGAVSSPADQGNGTWTATLTSSTVAGMAVVTAKHDGASLAGKAEVAFVAGPAAAASIANTASNGQTGTVGKPVQNPPSVKVADAHGNGVQGVTVTFAVTGGGGSVSGATQTTNAAGVATVGSWTLGSVAGPNALTATVSVPAADGEALALGDITVAFGATALADIAGAILLSAGDGQTAIAGSAVAIAPSVKVVDAANNPVSAVSVTFSVGSGGGSLTGAIATTNASGIATVGSWTLGNIAGSNSITASTPGVSGLVTITATGVAGPPSFIDVANAASVSQSAAAGTPVAIPPAVRVVDQRGNAVSGVAVTFAVMSGGGSITGGNAVTGIDGVATVGSWTLGLTAGANTLAAASGSLTGSPVTFNATGLAGSAGAITIVGGDGQTATAGSAVAVAPSVKVIDVNSNPVAGAVVTFSVLSGGGSVTGATATTSASGVATVGGWTLGTTAGTNQLAATSAGVTPVIFTATAIAGAASTVAINGGSGQSAVAGSPVAIAPSVRVTDANGNAVSGVAVSFAVASGGGSITGGNATTNSSGIAAVGSWTLGSSLGANSLTAVVASLSGSPLTFTATAIAGPPANIVKQAGDAQNAVAGSNVTVAPSVKVTSSNGLPLQGISVTFAVVLGGGSITNAVALTNNAGVATVGSWKLGNTAGANTLTASVGSLAPVTFTATGIAGTAALIAINGGNNQNATVGTPVAVAPSVKVTDTNGNPVAGAVVTFAIAAGGGTVTSGMPTTNAAGIATVGSWVLGSAAGANTLTASLSGVGGASVTFNATAMNVPPLNVAVTGRLERGEIVTVVVTQGGSTLSPSAYSLSLEPSDGGQVNGDGTVKLLKAAALKITATAGPSTGNTTITVTRPPLVVFDLVRDGARHIWQVAIDGGDLQKLTTVGSDNQHGSRVGDKLVYASARSGLDFNIWSMVVSTGVETQLTTAGAADTDPHISNDGSKLAFVTTTGGLARAHHANIDGSGAFPIADNTANTGSIEALPAWSPGSDKVVFSSTSLRGDMDLWIATTLGGVATRLASPANNASSAELSAAWSTDNRIAFLTNRAGKNEIWITDTDGNPATKLTDGSSPTWLTDGRIVFVRFTGSTGALFWIDPTNPDVVHPIDTGTGSAQRPSAVRP